MLDQADRDALMRAATFAVRELGANTPFEVRIDAVEGAAARLLVADKAGELEPLFGFAVKRGGTWSVIELGTGFDDEFYEEHGIPAKLQLE